jgi:hypothetical protein
MSRTLKAGGYPAHFDRHRIVRIQEMRERELREADPTLDSLNARSGVEGNQHEADEPSRRVTHLPYYNIPNRAKLNTPRIVR